MADYKEFVEFHDKHPDLDNTEYYAEFPDVNKSTVRSWKSRISKPIEEEIPTKKQADEHQGYEEQMADYVQLLKTRVGAKPTEYDGMDTKSKILILKDRLRVQNENQEKKTRSTNNSSILPMPKPIGSSTRQFGIDPYIEFDTNLNEIRMEIPMEILFDPEKNKALRSEIK